MFVLGGFVKRPWSLVRRLTAGVVVIVLLMVVVQALVLGLWMRPVAMQLTLATASQATMVREALRDMDTIDRDAFATRLSVGELRLTREPPKADSGETWRVPPSMLDDKVERRLAPDLQAEVARIDGLHALRVRLPLDDGEVWWLLRVGQAPSLELSRTLSIWLVLLAAVTVVALLLLVRWVAQPIALLTGQIAAQQGALRPLSVDPRASAELQSLVQAFNQMAAALEASAKARQQLLAGVSHDLRTPLARLRLRAETQLEPHIAQSLEDDLYALERIVDQFLAYVQSDRVGASGPQVELTECLRSVVQRHADAGRPVRLQLAAGLIPRPVAEMTCQRLIDNLIDNALAHGRPPLLVRVAPAVPAGVEICVIDQGPGMSAEEFERAQQPFVRLSAGRSALGHCGLGLAIAAQMARQLGGELSARYEGQQGFAVVVTLR